MDPEVLKLIGGSSLAGALLALIYIVGMKLVTAIDRVGVKIDEHTKTDVAHHTEVRSAVDKLDGKLDGLLDAQSRLTPAAGVAVVRHPTNG
jgi:uncharacterized protein YabE (DUF348 family)